MLLRIVNVFRRSGGFKGVHARLFYWSAVLVQHFILKLSAGAVSCNAGRDSHVYGRRNLHSNILCAAGSIGTGVSRLDRHIPTRYARYSADICIYSGYCRFACIGRLPCVIRRASRSRVVGIKPDTNFVWPIDGDR